MYASVKILSFIMFIMERGILRRLLKQPVEWTKKRQTHSSGSQSIAQWNTYCITYHVLKMLISGPTISGCTQGLRPLGHGLGICIFLRRSQTNFNAGGPKPT